MRKYYFSLLNNQLILALAFTLFQGYYLVAQVGIGTTTPQAMLDVVASDPANPTAKDGFLMPRVTSLTQDFQTTAVGTMVFYTGPTGVGYGNMKNTVYFFDGNNWKNMSGESASTADPHQLYDYDSTNKGVVFWIDPDDPYHYKIVAKDEFSLPYGSTQNNNPAECDEHMCSSGKLGGFERTKAWVLAHPGVDNSSYVNSMAYYYDGDTTPGSSSLGWYTPVLDELALILQNSSLINAGFPAGSDDVVTGVYYTSSEEDSNSNRMVGGISGGVFVGNYGSKTSSYPLRIVREIGG